MVLTRAHVASDGNHDLFRAVIQESCFCQLHDPDSGCILEFRFLEWLRNALTDISNAVLELVVLIACHDSSGGGFFGNVVRRDLYRTSVVFFELRNLVGLAFDTSHGALYVVVMCVSTLVEGAVGVVMRQKGEIYGGLCSSDQ